MAGNESEEDPPDMERLSSEELISLGVEQFELSNTDQAAIRKFLSLPSPDETLKLAAQMSPRSERGSADDTIDAAINLYLSVNDRIANRREMMLTEMSWAAVSLLYTCITHYDPEVEYDQKYLRSLNDPVKESVIRIMKKMLEETNYEDFFERICEETLEAFERRKKIPRPSIPCDKISAIRYSTSLQGRYSEISDRWLMKALGDYFYFVTINPHENSRMVGRYKFKGIKNKITILPEYIGFETEYLNKKNEIFQELMKGGRVLDFQKRFKFGGANRNVPPLVNELVEMEHRNIFDGKGLVRDKRSLAILAERFRDFWLRHKEIYFDAYTTEREKIQASLRIRERTKWVARIKDFTESKPFGNFLGRECQQRGSTEFKEAVDKFTEKYSKNGTKDDRPKKILRMFLVHLFPHIASTKMINVMEFQAVMEKEAGIKVLSEDTIEKCYNLLKAALENKKTETAAGMPLQKKEAPKKRGTKPQ